MYAVKFEKMFTPVCMFFDTKEEAEKYKKKIEGMMPGTQVVIQYIWVADNQYLSREFQFTDKYGQKHCYVVADEAINAVVDENDNIDIGI